MMSSASDRAHRQHSARAAWSVWGCALAALAVSAVLSILAGAPFLARLPTAMTFALAFATVGALIAARQPANAVGWICLGIGGMFALTLLVVSYADYAVLSRSGTLPGTRLSVWFNNWIWFADLAPVGLVLLLFPDGQPPTQRWRCVAWLILFGALTVIAAAAVTPGMMVYEGHVVAENPFGIGLPDRLIDVLTVVGGTVLLCGLAGSVVSLILRFRGSHGLERQQLKWLALAAALVAIAPTWFILAEVPAISEVRGLVNLQYVLLTGSLTAVPVAIGVAILRFNLYDIDRIINRALVYTALTATLLTLYLAIVLGLSQMIQVVSNESSQLVIAASTLIVAAAFRPLRGRIQSIVDHRFYRRRYDAARTIDLFTARMRDMVDIAAVEEALVGTVFATMQPAHVSLWLRASAAAQHSPQAGGRVNEDRRGKPRLPAVPTPRH